MHSNTSSKAFIFILFSILFSKMAIFRDIFGKIGKTTPPPTIRDRRVVNLKTKILGNLFSQIYMIMLFMVSQLTLKYAWGPQFWRRYQKFWQNWEKIFVFFGKILAKNEILPKKSVHCTFSAEILTLGLFLCMIIRNSTRVSKFFQIRKEPV